MSELKLLKKHKSFGGWVEFYSHPSSSTKTDMGFSFYRPPQAQSGKVPVLIWLSGLTCTEENFIAKAGAQRFASEKGIMVVCPDTSPRGTNIPGEHDSWDFGAGAGFYLNATTELWKNNYRMYDYVANELLELMKTEFPADMSRVGIFGHSMGGHGALTIALKNPGKFRSVSAFSPIVAPTQCPWGIKAFTNYLGEDRTTWNDYDSCELIKKATVKLPTLIDQGTNDEFLDTQLKPGLLLDVCKKFDYPVNFRMQEGFDHSYYFISTFIKDHIDFHDQNLST